MWVFAVRLKKNSVAGGIGAINRITVTGETVHGFVEEAIPSFCEFSITAADDVKVSDVHAQADATLIWKSIGPGGATGKALILRNAYSVNAPQITAGEGETPFRFESEGEWEEL